jgi:hypothetical protein
MLPFICYLWSANSFSVPLIYYQRSVISDLLPLVSHLLYATSDKLKLWPVTSESCLWPVTFKCHRWSVTSDLLPLNWYQICYLWFGTSDPLHIICCLWSVTSDTVCYFWSVISFSLPAPAYLLPMVSYSTTDIFQLWPVTFESCLWPFTYLCHLWHLIRDLVPLIWYLWSVTSDRVPMIWYLWWSVASDLLPLICCLWSVTSDMLLLMCYLWSLTPLCFVTSDIFQLWPVSSVSWPFTYYYYYLWYFTSYLLPIIRFLWAVIFGLLPMIWVTSGLPPLNVTFDSLFLICYF